MSAYHQLTGIIVDPKNSTLLVLPDKNNRLILPRINLNNGLNATAELKSELSKEYLLELKYIRSLPNSWESLISLHAKMVNKLNIYHIFYLQKALTRNTAYELLNIKTLDLERFSKDRPALEFFQEIYAIIDELS